MRICILFLSAFCFASSGVAQQPKQDKPHETGQLANPISREQVLKLPRRDKAPEIPLEKALKIAGKFVKRQKIDISCCYLFEAKWSQSEDERAPSWHLWWVAIRGKPATSDVRITVSMDGTARMTRPASQRFSWNHQN